MNDLVLKYRREWFYDVVMEELESDHHLKAQEAHKAETGLVEASFRPREDLR